MSSSEAALKIFFMSLVFGVPSLDPHSPIPWRERAPPCLLYSPVVFLYAFIVGTEMTTSPLAPPPCTCSRTHAAWAGGGRQMWSHMQDKFPYSDFNAIAKGRGREGERASIPCPPSLHLPLWADNGGGNLCESVQLPRTASAA